MSELHSLVGLLPFEWAQLEFMQYALLAIILVAPLFTMLGTLVVNNRMAFFSDTLGHSALTGIALGVLIGISDPLWAMLAFAIIVALSVNYIKNRTGASTDTVIGVLSATAVALGIAILSQGGGFARYSRYLIGDLLSITPRDIIGLALVLVVVFLIMLGTSNQLLLASINSSLARSRGVHVGLVELLFTLSLAVVVTISIQWIGILIINSLLILPAAAARNWCRDMKSYHLITFIIILLCGVAGLIISFYWNMATGATIVLLIAVIYIISLILHRA
ncbi:MAG: metal ABC transporter permease [Syntrophomonas sp.]